MSVGTTTSDIAKHMRLLIAGTRGPLDLVEVASHVMELFLEDPRVMQLISNAGQGGQDSISSLGQAAAWQRSRQQFQCLQLQHQVKYKVNASTGHGSNL